MSLDTVSILDGNSFLVTDRRGDVETASRDHPQGLFHFDTRFLSKWILTVNGIRPSVLSIENLHYYEVQHFLVPESGTVYINSEVSLIRKHFVTQGFVETLTILNHADEPKEMHLRIEVDADFDDLFEVKDALKKKGEFYRRVEEGALVIGYRRDQYFCETRIRSDEAPTFDEDGLRFQVTVPPHSQWTTRISVDDLMPDEHRSTTSKDPAMSAEARRRKRQEEVRRWTEEAPVLHSPWRSLERTYERSLADLAALRFYPALAAGAAVPAAGLPWFMAMFGRDSLLTSYQALPFSPELARTTLFILSNYQGLTRDDFRDEEPGKILHELRWGEMTAFEERPHSPYYGASDSTPLFLILLDEYERWTGDRDFVRSLEYSARAALEWIDHHGDLDMDGYVEYERRNKETGLENQCWKDSWDAIKFHDGRLAKVPIATCEIQGYVYDAKRRCARLARTIWNDENLASRLESEALELKTRFNRDFWIEDGAFFALALDGEKKKVDSLTSNLGHLLWSGIADPEKAAACVKHLMGDRLNSGWGIRTMATGDAAYNPIGYHVGTIWPHENSFITWGLRRYGYADEAAQLAQAMLEAADFFQGRLPEAFAGYPRGLTGAPVEYPTACSPQAWAAGAPMLLLRSLLGLEPVEGKLLVDPAIPERIASIELTRIPGRWGRSDAFGRGRVRVADWREKHPELGQVA
jgi:glycogen debranching enzyme